jgi:hypothetical protein
MILGLLVVPGLLAAQDLGEAARKERARQAAVKNPAKVITNDVLGVKSSPLPTPSSPKGESPSATVHEILDKLGHNERYWSERFLIVRKRVTDAEQKLEMLETRIKEYNDRLLMRSDVYDREHLYPELIASSTKDQQDTKKELVDAKLAVEALRRLLRDSGGPAEWADSQVAAQPEMPEHPTREDYLKRLKAIDDQYEEMARPYKVERFQLVNRRAPSKDDSLQIDISRLGLGADPSLPSLDDKIGEIEKKHQQARSEIISQAQRNGINIQ